MLAATTYFWLKSRRFLRYGPKNMVVYYYISNRTTSIPTQYVVNLSTHWLTRIERRRNYLLRHGLGYDSALEQTKQEMYVARIWSEEELLNG